MLGFIKYKLFKWLWDDVCRKVDCCETCPVKMVCKKQDMDCYDFEDIMLEAARSAWRIY